MKVAVGSTNPLKVRAVKNVMKKIYGDVEVIPIRVPSKVSHTPLTDEECVEGAINRAKAAIEKTNADLGIGLEGGVIRRVGRYFVTGWCAVVDRNGEVALGYSGGVELPDKVVRAVLEGRELGDVMDEFVGIRNVKKKMGAIGILTNGLSNRRKATEEVIIYAMAKRLRPELYK